MTLASKAFTASQLSEIAKTLGLHDARIHMPGRDARAWQWQGDWFWQWHNAPPDLKRWHGMVISVDGRPMLLHVTDVTYYGEVANGRAYPTTGKDFIIHHWLDAYTPPASSWELTENVGRLKQVLGIE